MVVGYDAVVLLDGAAPPLVGKGLEVLEMGVVEVEVEVTAGGTVDELDVVVGFGVSKAPVGGVGEHHLLVETELLGLGKDPLVGGADDGLLADEKVGLNGGLLVKAGLLDADRRWESGKGG